MHKIPTHRYPLAGASSYPMRHGHTMCPLGEQYSYALAPNHHVVGRGNLTRHCSLHCHDTARRVAAPYDTHDPHRTETADGRTPPLQVLTEPPG